MHCVTFSRDGCCVAFGASDGTVWIWNPSTGEIHNNSVNKAERGHWARSVAFSHDDNHVISGWENAEVWIWNVMTNKSTMLSEWWIQLPDGTWVHPLDRNSFRIYDPGDQETTNGIPPYLLSISPDCEWITGEQGEHSCWIPPQYRIISKAHIAKSIVCLQVSSGMIVLDLKSTQRAEHVMPGVWVSPGWFMSGCGRLISAVIKMDIQCSFIILSPYEHISICFGTR